MIPAKHVMGAAHVFPGNGVEDSLSGAGITHIPEQNGGHMHACLKITVLPQCIVGEHYRLINIVAGPLLTDDATDQNCVSIGSKPCAFHQPFVSGMGDVSGLMSHEFFPPKLSHFLSHALGRIPVLVEWGIYYWRIVYRNLAAEELVLIRKGSLNTGMLFLSDSIDFL